MKAAKRKVTDMTVDELKGVIHEVIAEDMEAWRETFEIMADSKLMNQIRQADRDRAAGKKGSFIAGTSLKMSKIILHRNAVKFYRIADEVLKNRIVDAVDTIARNSRLDGHISRN